VARILIEYEVDASGALREVKRVESGLKRTGPAAEQAARGMHSLSSALKVAAAAFASVQVGRFLRDSIRAAAEQEAIFRRLAASMGNVGVAYNQVAGDLQSLFAELQRTTVYGDTDSAQALQRLIAVTQDYDASLKLLAPTLDMAAANTMDVAMAGEVVGRAIAGNIGSLSRFGVVLDAATKELLQNADAAGRAAIMARVLRERFGGAAAAELDTYAGRTKKLANYYSDLRETIGAVITSVASSPTAFDELRRVITWTTDAVIELGKAFVVGLEFIKGAPTLLAADFARLKIAVYSLVADINRAWAKMPALLGGGKAAEGRALEASRKALQATVEAVAGFSSVAERAARAGEEFVESVRLLRIAGGDAARDLHDAAAGADDLAESLDAAALQGEDFVPIFEAVNTTLGMTVGELNELLVAWNEFVREWSTGAFDFTPLATHLPQPEEVDRLGQMLTDTIVSVFSDQGGDIADAWEALAAQLAQTLADALTKGLSAELFGGKGLGEALFGGLFEYDEEGNIVGLKGVGKAVAGLGLAYGAYGGFKQGGVLGALQSGASVYALMQLIPGVGQVASIVAAAIAALVAGVFGGGETPPTPSYVGGWAPGTGAFGTGRDFPSGAPIERFHKAVNETVRTVFSGFMDALERFGRADLFELMRLSAINFPAVNTRDWQNVFQQILQDWLPGQIQNQLAPAFYEAFYGLGYSQEFVDRLFAEMGQLGADERLRFLQDVVAGAVGLAEAISDVSFETVSALADESSWEAFGRGMGELLDQIAVIQARMESELDLAAAGRDAARIADLVQQAGQAAQQLLRQIRELAESIHQSIAAQIEGFRLAGMTPFERVQYLRSRIAELMGQLGAAESPEAVQFLVQQIQQLASLLWQAAQQAGYSINEAVPWLTPGGERQSWLDWLTSLLEDVDRTAGDVLGGFEDEIRDWLDQFQEAGETARDAFAALGESAAASGEELSAASEAAGALRDAAEAAAEALLRFQERLLDVAASSAPAAPAVVVQIDGRLAPMIGLIDARIDERLMAGDWS